MTNFPKIIFVDGPTGVGKDYFIDKLYSNLSSKFLNDKVKIVRATDIVLNSDTETENRKYLTYSTEETKKYNIFIGHVNLLLYLNNLVNVNKEADVVIVNRSFISFLIYNVYPNIDKENIEVKEKNYLNHQLSSYISIFSQVYKNLFYNNTSTLFINLDIKTNDINDKLNIISNRIYNRNDNKPINTEWLKYIIKNYNKLDNDLIKIFNFYETIDSNEYVYIVNRYFNFFQCLI